jgi:hypothetical protein
VSTWEIVDAAIAVVCILCGIVLLVHGNWEDVKRFVQRKHHLSKTSSVLRSFLDYGYHAKAAGGVGLVLLGVSLLVYLVFNLGCTHDRFSPTGLLFTGVMGVLTILSLFVTIHVAHMLRQRIVSWGGLLSAFLRDLGHISVLVHPAKHQIPGDEFHLRLLLYTPNPGGISIENTESSEYKRFGDYLELMIDLSHNGVNMDIIMLTPGRVFDMLESLHKLERYKETRKATAFLDCKTSDDARNCRIWRHAALPNNHCFVIEGESSIAATTIEVPTAAYDFMLTVPVNGERHDVRGFRSTESHELEYRLATIKWYMRKIAMPVRAESFEVEASGNIKFKLEYFAQVSQRLTSENPDTWQDVLLADAIEIFISDDEHHLPYDNLTACRLCDIPLKLGNASNTGQPFIEWRTLFDTPAALGTVGPLPLDRADLMILSSDRVKAERVNNGVLQKYQGKNARDLCFRSRFVKRASCKLETSVEHRSDPSDVWRVTG